MKVLLNVRVLLAYFLLMFIASNAYSDCRNDIFEDTPSSDFIVNINGTVTHISTGLMWMRCTLGQTWNGTTCIGSANLMDWPSSLSAAKNYKLDNYSDWRLPNINELESIAERRCAEPAINENIFPYTRIGYYWSSTPVIVDPQRTAASILNFSDGGVYSNPTTNKLAVRLVRGE